MRFREITGVGRGSLRGSFAALAVISIAASQAWAGYAGTLLYPLTPPPALTQGYQQINSDDAGQVVANDTTAGTRALFWPGTSSVIDLTPSGQSESQVDGIGGGQQVGQVGSIASLWTGTAASYIDLNPSRFMSSAALGTDGGQQVGYATMNPNGPSHAFLWNGTASSAIDLSPPGLSPSEGSEALATDGAQQVGVGGNGAANALLWSGTAASYVDLNPSGINTSLADAVSGSEEVGYGAAPGTPPQFSLAGSNVHALLWTGSASSYVDLNPNGYIDSKALGTNGIQQVGEGQLTSAAPLEAYLWSGTANSAVDLELLLPSTDTWSASEANSIDPAGNVFGWAIDASGDYFAVEWSPVPEPASAALIMIGCATLLIRRGNSRD